MTILTKQRNVTQNDFILKFYYIRRHSPFKRKTPKRIVIQRSKEERQITQLLVVRLNVWSEIQRCYLQGRPDVGSMAIERLDIRDYCYHS